MTDDWSIDVSNRLRRLPPYLFGQINALKYKKRVADVDIIDLGMGNPLDAPPPQVVEKLCEAARNPRNHRYSDSSGVFNLRREAAKLYKKLYNVALDPEKEVVAVIGSKEGFSHMCLALMGPGDTAVVGDPYFPIHVYGVALAGANVINVTMGNDEEFLKRVAYVVEHLYPRPKVLILNYPHNPTAMTVDGVDFFEAVVDLAKRFGIKVIHDFAYWRTCFDGYVAPSFLQARGAGNAEMVRALKTIKGYYDYGIFQAIQIASIIAMRTGEPDVAAQAKVYEHRRDVVVNGLRRLGWEVESPRASMFVWAKIAPQHLAGAGTLEFTLRMMEEAEVALAPGRAFGVNGEGYVRIALVENDQRLRQAIRQLDGALNKGIVAPSATKKTTGRRRKRRRS